MPARMIPVFISVALLSAGAALAQARGPQVSGAPHLPNVKPPSFASLFPNPTHNNGYEEWVQAADLIQNNANVEALIVQPDATLSFKRHVDLCRIYSQCVKGRRFAVCYTQQTKRGTP